MGLLLFPADATSISRLMAIPFSPNSPHFACCADTSVIIRTGNPRRERRMTAAPKRVLQTVTENGRRVGRPKNIDIRMREHLTPSEVELLARRLRCAVVMATATRSRSG